MRISCHKVGHLIEHSKDNTSEIKEGETAVGNKLDKKERTAAKIILKERFISFRNKRRRFELSCSNWTHHQEWPMRYFYLVKWNIYKKLSECKEKFLRIVGVDFFRCWLFRCCEDCWWFVIIDAPIIIIIIIIIIIVSIYNCHYFILFR